jgi:hypothetical protein
MHPLTNDAKVCKQLPAYPPIALRSGCYPFGYTIVSRLPSPIRYRFFPVAARVHTSKVSDGFISCWQTFAFPQVGKPLDFEIQSRASYFRSRWKNVVRPRVTTLFLFHITHMCSSSTTKSMQRLLKLDLPLCFSPRPSNPSSTTTLSRIPYT